MHSYEESCTKKDRQLNNINEETTHKELFDQFSLAEEVQPPCVELDHPTFTNNDTENSSTELKSIVNTEPADEKRQKFRIRDANGKYVSVKGGHVSLINNEGDVFVIGKHNNLIAFHKNLVYECGVDMESSITTHRLPGQRFSVQTHHSRNVLVCNDFLLLSANLKFTTEAKQPFTIIFET